MRAWTGLSFALLASLALGSSALADDSSAELGMGGIRFTRTDAIQMVSEDLFLSADAVRIHYVFHNRTAHDITTLVAFPLPDVSPDYYFEPINFPDRADPNFVHFETRVDGHPMAMQMEQHAKLHGTDVTARVRAAGLPLSPVDPHFDDAVAHMTPAARAQAVRGHLIEDTSGDPKEPQYRALWTLSTNFSRTQIFPAGRDIVVDQSYRPIVGSSVETVLLIDSIPRTNHDRQNFVRQYCVDDVFERAARETAHRFGGPEHVFQQSIAYVLRTGANWAGPIGRFHLTIDKGKPENLMSVCADGIRRTSQTQFEWERTNYTPREDIHVLLLVPTHGE